MFEKSLTALKFAIVATTTANIEIIKTAFNQLPINISLQKSYKNVESFIETYSQLGAVDFIVTDENAFARLDDQKIQLTEPLVVFTDGHTEIIPAFQIIFDTIIMPALSQNLQSLLKKLEITKKHFEKNNSLISSSNKTEGLPKTFLIKRGRDFQLLNTNNVSVFYTDNKLTFAFDDKGNKFLVPSTLIELENQLSTKIFFRANRQSLINRKYINKVKHIEEGRYEIIVDAIDSLKIDINQQKFSKLKEWIESN